MSFVYMLADSNNNVRLGTTSTLIRKDKKTPSITPNIENYFRRTKKFYNMKEAYIIVVNYYDYDKNYHNGNYRIILKQKI